MGILRKVLLVPQPKKYLISEGQLAWKIGWAVNTKNIWKRAVNDEGEVLIEGILDDCNLYVIDPAYFPDISEVMHMEVVEENETTTVWWTWLRRRK